MVGRLAFLGVAGLFIAALVRGDSFLVLLGVAAFIAACMAFGKRLEAKSYPRALGGAFYGHLVARDSAILRALGGTTR
jgi:hypothetical protein